MSRVLIVLAVILLVPIVFMLGLLLLLDEPEYYRQQLAVTVQEQTGFELSINGDLNWRYWPPIAIEITDVEIRPSGASKPLAKLNAASVDLKLLSVLTGGSTLAIDGFSIDGLELNALIDAEGNANWEVSGNATRPTPTVGEDPASADANTGSDTAMDLDIASIEITNSVINYEDLAANSHYTLDLHSFTTGSVSYGQPTAIQFEIGFEDKMADIGGTSSGAGDITFDSDFIQYTFSQLRLDNTLLMPDMAPLDLSLTINGAADLNAASASLKDSSFQAAELEGTLNLDIVDLMDAPQLSGRLQVSPFDAKALMLKLDQSAIETANPNAATNIAFSTNISGTMPDITLGSIEATIDNSELKGRIDIHLGDKIKVQFDLEMDRIVASDYLPPDDLAAAETPSGPASTPAGTSTPEPSAQVSEDSEVLPIDLLDEYDFSGVFTLHNVIYDTYSFSDLKTKVANGGHRLAVNLTTLGYDGELKLDLEVRTDKPGGKTSFDIDGMNITKLTEFEWITGTLNLNSTTRFKGKMLSELLDSLDGTNRFTIDDGALDITPIKKVATVIDSLRGKFSGISEWPDKLPFEQLKGKHALHDGIEANQELNLKVENMTIEGEGGVDYWQNTLLYDLNIVLEESVDGQYQVSPLITDVRWPLHCEGAMDASPVTLCLPDRKAIQTVVGDLVKREIQRQGREEIEKRIEEKIPDKLKDKAKKLLKGLFDN